MHKKIVLFIVTAMALLSCNSDQKNPFFTAFSTPNGVPPFDQIKTEHYLPAFTEGITQHNAEIEQIIQQTELANFDNTVVALDNSGALLERTSLVFYAMDNAESNADIQQIAQQVSPLLSEHNDNVYLNEALFSRVQTVNNYVQEHPEEFTTEQKRLLDTYYKRFVRSGILLSAQDKETLREINKELSMLSLTFGQNLLAETNSYQLLIDNKEDLEGLPEGVVAAAAEEAQAHNQAGKWMFTLHKPSWIPFMQYAKNRELRRQVYQAMYMRGDNDNDKDNKALVNKMVNLRLKKANLLGYPTHAHYVLDETMAKTPEKVYQLLNQLWEYALPQAKKERDELQQLIKQEGGDFQLASWDWWYYAEKLRKAKYDLDEEELRPYFKLENVRQGVFAVANKLYGLEFSVLDQVSVYHPDATAYQVNDADGSLIGIIYLDYFPRPGKRGGAWMGNFSEQYQLGAQNVRPVIYNVGNFTKPTAETPSLLTLDEVETLFHEFGHALHGLLSQVQYKGLSGTNVPRDFVELPSQVLEHWAFHPEVLPLYATHYQTGEPIPAALVQKMEKAASFNQGFMTTELVAAALLDMDWHTLTQEGDIDVRSFEQASLEKIGLIPEIIVRYRSTYFAHIFDGGYSAGYYSYLWSEVLDADAFQLFEEKGVFDPATARSFRENVLSKGNSEDPMVLYTRFRGAEPNPIYLLQNRGFLPK